MLSWVEWSYNTSKNASTSVSPFGVTFGRKPPVVPQYIEGTSNLDDIDTLLINKDKEFERLCKKLLKSQEQMKHFADHMRWEVHYTVGDMVMVKLRPYQQSSATGTPYLKLAKHYYDPFQIIERIGKVAYKLMNSSSIPLFSSKTF